LASKRVGFFMQRFGRFLIYGCGLDPSGLSFYVTIITFGDYGELMGVDGDWFLNIPG
jgi:hypothetical protein